MTSAPSPLTTMIPFPVLPFALAPEFELPEFATSSSSLIDVPLVATYLRCCSRCSSSLFSEPPGGPPPEDTCTATAEFGVTATVGACATTAEDIDRCCRTDGIDVADGVERVDDDCCSSDDDWVMVDDGDDGKVNGFDDEQYKAKDSWR